MLNHANIQAAPAAWHIQYKSLDHVTDEQLSLFRGRIKPIIFGITYGMRITLLNTSDKQLIAAYERAGLELVRRRHA